MAATACVETDELNLEVIKTACEVGVTWLGRAAGSGQTEQIEPVLAQILEDANTSGKPIKMHFEGIKHFNSTTLALLMTFLLRARSEQVRVVVTYDADCSWQRIAFRAVTRMGLSSELVEVHGL